MLALYQQLKEINMLKSLKRLLISLPLLLAITGCAYRMDIQQGKIISPEKAKMIHIGMSSREVTQTLGKPVLTQLFTKNQVVYVYTLTKGHGKMTQRHLTITFRHNRVTHIDTNIVTN